MNNPTETVPSEEVTKESTDSSAPDAKDDKPLEEAATVTKEDSTEKLTPPPATDDVEDDEKPFTDDEEPKSDEDEELDWDKEAELPKNLKEAKKLRSENARKNLAYKELKAKYEAVIEANQAREAAEEARKVEEAVLVKKKEVIQKYGLSDEDLDLFVSSNEEDWEKLAKRITPPTERITQDEPVGPKGGKATNLSPEEAYQLTRPVRRY
jgi:DNA-binding Lrp family transcriptional regulator